MIPFIERMQAAWIYKGAFFIADGYECVEVPVCFCGPQLEEHPVALGFAAVGADPPQLAGRQILHEDVDRGNGRRAAARRRAVNTLTSADRPGSVRRT